MSHIYDRYAHCCAFPEMEKNDPNYASMDIARMLRIVIYLKCKGPLIGG